MGGTTAATGGGAGGGGGGAGAAQAASTAVMAVAARARERRRGLAGVIGSLPHGRVESSLDVAPDKKVASHGRRPLGKRGRTGEPAILVEEFRHALLVGDAADRLADQAVAADVADLAAVAGAVGRGDGIGHHQLLQDGGVDP